MQKLSAFTSSALRKHGLRAQRIRLPTTVAITNRALSATPHLTPEHSRHVKSTAETETETETWSPPSSKAQFSASEPEALDGLDGNTPDEDHKPPNERIVKLGKTLRILSPLLPNILIHPLPQEILSPSITLHLFPSTHPHLPTVKGRVPYRAALWTAPVAWGSVPIVGDVKLQVSSERMVRAGSVMDFENQDNSNDEKLVVRWKTEGKRSDSGTTSSAKEGNTSHTDTSPQSLDHTSSTGSSSSGNGTNRGLSALLGGDSPIFKLGKEEQFSGLFIFSFDEEGKIINHTIEHADEINGWDRTPRVVSLTDWLLGKARWGHSLEPGLAFDGRHGSKTSCSDTESPTGRDNGLDGEFETGR